MGRTQSIVSAVAVLVIAIAGIAGVSVSEDMVVEVVSAIATIVVTAYGIWRNHNFTDAAISGQCLADSIKGGFDDGIKAGGTDE